MRRIAVMCVLWLLGLPAAGVADPPDVPDRVVVLTFDDSVKSHFTVVRPILKRYQFGATFFVTEGFDFATNKEDYMTWQQIAALAADGFEIGNHTRDHLAVTEQNVERLDEQLAAIEQRCAEFSIPKPVSFAYPGNQFHPSAFEILQRHGIQFARRGGAPEYPYEQGRGFAYEIGLDHPLLLPSAGDARPDWTMDDFRRAVSQARHGRIAILQFHGVPDNAHPWVHTHPEQFRQYMQYLADNDYHVMALRDLARYIPAGSAPRDPMGIIQDRQAALENGRDRENTRRPASDDELRIWLANMLIHRFHPIEMAAATGLTTQELSAAIDRFKFSVDRLPTRTAEEPLWVLPYPGGRHPRIGFRDGMIRPQRETKVSVFTPWADGGYVVADTPEAIWFEPDGGRQLLYLAHTHVPTYWDRQNVQLEPLEWELTDNGFRMQRTLPNQVRFGTSVEPRPDGVAMTMWIHNGSPETLRGLRVQNCVMLGRAVGFSDLTSDNKRIQEPFVACRNQDGTRWIITAWEPCLRPWSNPPCPCMHSDPQFPDCAPGETKTIHGWLSFYEGTDIESELRRLQKAVFTD